MELLESMDSVLVIDWPSREVPEALARGGWRVVVRGGPGPRDFSAYEVEGGQAVSRNIGAPPDHADLVYSYRPLDELPGIVALAKSLQARAVWTQSGFASAGVRDPHGCWVAEDREQWARQLAESEGLIYVSAPYIADVAARSRPR